MAGDSPQSYYCCGCQRTVTLTPLPNSELSCPNCNSTVLEESETVPPPDPITGNNSFGDRIPIAFSTGSGGSDGGDLSAVLGGGAFPGQSSIELDPAVLSNSNLRDGASVLSMLENNRIVGGGSENRLPDHLLRILRPRRIRRFTVSGLNMLGTPPAAKWAVSDLPWLEMRNSCPLCRYELPTDENRRALRQSTNTSTSTAESHAETSNSGGGGTNDGVNNDGNDSSSNNTHGESNPSPGGQDTQEDS